MRGKKAIQPLCKTMRRIFAKRADKAWLVEQEIVRSHVYHQYQQGCPDQEYQTKNKHSTQTHRSQSWYESRSVSAPERHDKVSRRRHCWTCAYVCMCAYEAFCMVTRELQLKKQYISDWARQLQKYVSCFVLKSKVQLLTDRDGLDVRTL